METRTVVQVIAIPIDAKDSTNEERLARGLSQLMAEDPTIRLTSDSTAGHVVVAGISELHLEIIIDRLRREFDVEAGVGRPVILLKEAIRDSVVGVIKHAVESRREYAHVKLRVSPREDGTGYLFESHILGDSIPPRFIAAIEQGISETRLRGVCGDYPLDDIKVELLDGSYHDRDSSDAAFIAAARRAFFEAAVKAKPTVVEPVMQVEVLVPGDCLVDVVRDLEGRRAAVQSCEARDNQHVIVVRVPFAQMLGYGTDLSARTRGRATYAMRFVRYQPRPERSNPGDGDRVSLVGAPRKPVVPGRLDAIALPEPDEDDNSDDDWLQPRS